MTIKLSTALCTAMIGSQGFVGAMSNGVIDIYSGVQPTSANDAPNGTLLGTVTLNGGAFTPGSPTNGLTFGAPSAGVVAKSGTWSLTAVASGTAGWFRFRGNAADPGTSSTTALRLDGTVGTSGADLIVSTVSITTGTPVTIDSFTFTMPSQ